MDVIEIFKNRKAIYSFKELVASYSDSEFDSPRRSTVLLLDYWRSFDDAVKRSEEYICADFSNQIRLHFEYDEISSLPYQLIHRSASACFAPASSRRVVYQVFDPTKQDYYSKCLHEMARLFQEGSTLSFWLMLCPFEPLEDYQKLLDQWDRTTPKPKISSQVKPMLISRRLARFHEPQLVRFA